MTSPYVNNTEASFNCPKIGFVPAVWYPGDTRAETHTAASSHPLSAPPRHCFRQPRRCCGGCLPTAKELVVGVVPLPFDVARGASD